MKNSKPAVMAMPSKGKPLKRQLMDHWQLYAMLVIPVLLTIIYKYIPMYGIQIAFRDYKASKGMIGSEWVGLEWFQRFFSAPTCTRMLKNTVLLSLYSLLWSFPIPIILALMLNQMRFQRFKRTTQTVLYAPHFISTMVICGMIRIFLSPSGGLINLIAGEEINSSYCNFVGMNHGHSKSLKYCTYLSSFILLRTTLKKLEQLPSPPNSHNITP